MRIKVLGLAGLLLFTLACSLSAPNTPPQPGVETGVAATFQALTASAPAPTALSGIAVSFQNVSLVIPEGLASGANSELVPVANETNSDPWSMAPEHILFTLTNYSGPVGSLDPVVRIYPAQEYIAVNSWAAGSFTRLQAILANPSGPLTNDTLPTVPFNGGAAQQYAAKAKLLPFNGGTGVRMISQYAQYPAPITKDGSFYHYEGLTKDGKYFVAVLLPVTRPLQATADNPSADGISYPAIGTDTPEEFTAYYQGITDLLNAANPETYQPSLTQLDALVQSITVNSQ